MEDIKSLLFEAPPLLVIITSSSLSSSIEYKKFITSSLSLSSPSSRFSFSSPIYLLLVSSKTSSTPSSFACSISSSANNSFSSNKSFWFDLCVWVIRFSISSIVFFNCFVESFLVSVPRDISISRVVFDLSKHNLSIFVFDIEVDLGSMLRRNKLSIKMGMVVI